MNIYAMMFLALTVGGPLLGIVAVECETRAAEEADPARAALPQVIYPSYVPTSPDAYLKTQRPRVVSLVKPVSLIKR